jgi:predicted lipoprotein with Yx(FWY)xxD motif
MQVTYNGWPLYYFAPDEQPGDTKGHEVDGFGAEWYVVTPEGEPLAAAEAAAAEATPTQEATMAENAVVVADQSLGAGDTVTIDSVSAAVDGWIVIHADADGSPGPVIGHAPVAAGENSDVVVDIDAARATDTLYAMLHVDAGTAGEYEFPGDDGPARDAGDNVVTPPFQVELSSVNAVSVNDQALAEGDTVTVAAVRSAGPGWIVIHADDGGSPGMVIGHAAVESGLNRDVVVDIDAANATDTLYAMLHVDAGTTGEYEFPGDDVPATDAGNTGDYDLSGNGDDSAGGNIVTPAFNLLSPTVMVGSNDELGDFLVAANGMTLYLFENDATNRSNCYDQCADAWPPLTVDDGQAPVAGPGLSGNLGTTTRDDGSIQVTYSGIPLYFYAADQEPGDVTGQGVGDVWFVVAP